MGEATKTFSAWLCNQCDTGDASGAYAMRLSHRRHLPYQGFVGKRLLGWGHA